MKNKLTSSQKAEIIDRVRTNFDPVNHPKHYNIHPSGVECIDVVEHMSFNLGNAVKYVWRFENKNGLEDLHKAKWYIEREIERLTKERTGGPR